MYFLYVYNKGIIIIMYTCKYLLRSVVLKLKLKQYNNGSNHIHKEAYFTQVTCLNIILRITSNELNGNIFSLKA